MIDPPLLDVLARLAVIAMLLSFSDSSAKTAAAPEPSGASLAFTSADPALVEARRLVAAGEFSRAEALLRDGSSDPDARGQMLEIIARMCWAYRLDAAGLLARIRREIPDATAADLERWRAAAEVQYRTIDGGVGYFAREPANLWRFCGEAKRRRAQPAASAPTWTLRDHLARVVDAAEREHRDRVVPIRHRVHNVVTISPDAPGLKHGALVRVWLPFPQEYRQQGNVKLIRTSPANGIVAPAASPQRTVYLERRVEDPKTPLNFEEVFEFTASAYYPRLDDAKARPLPAGWAGGGLSERPPHIAFTPKLRQAVARVVGAETNPLAKARKIFEFVSTIAYCSEEEYSTIPSLSDKCLTCGRGDCGVHAMLFITMCRAAGIPARWQSGWQTERVGYDMHDWCEFYVGPWGWLPADPTYGFEKSDDPRVRDFHFGHLPAYRMIVNLDYGSDLSPPKKSLRSEPLDFQRGEVEIDGKNLYFRYWDYDMRIEWVDDGP